MPTTINISLTSELRSYIDRNCGDSGLFATPSEFIRALLREKKERQEASAIREGVMEGYRDLMAGRTIEFKGSLRSSLEEARRLEQNGWPT